MSGILWTLILAAVLMACCCYLTFKAIDWLVSLAVFCHSFCRSQLVFDDYEAEIFRLEAEGNTGKLYREQAAFKAEQEKYDRQVKQCPVKYAFCRLFFRESHFIRTYRPMT
ncbi:hypothetical protein [Bacteroides ovatus]|uniref:hypothetical protein n=1 Tax=Bacteroides ovatus TaxID=28116 RepID=UPI001B8D505F|nr:hypothetical protein [Bacteroides ovatus]MCE8873764.1 hypothetical protein [Bacteroides ovatus]QUT82606.1 hypothetical protein INE80_04649 [Bacteroides ovatus]